ncbi:MAG: hypothetical protein J6V68_04020 [Clostridia bacterium]|nr:hypothetical protein [Clostridia bacterium]
MAKTILLSLLIPIFSIIGKRFSKKYELLRSFFEDFQLFINIFEKEIDFSEKSLKEIINDFPKKNGDFYQFLTNAIFNKEIIKPNYILDSDFSLINNFIKELGISDKYTQKNIVLDFKNYLKSSYEKAKKDENVNKNLYFKLGLLFGLFIFILLF